MQKKVFIYLNDEYYNSDPITVHYGGIKKEILMKIVKEYFTIQCDALKLPYPQFDFCDKISPLTQNQSLVYVGLLPPFEDEKVRKEFFASPWRNSISISLDLYLNLEVDHQISYLKSRINDFLIDSSFEKSYPTFVESALIKKYRNFLQKHGRVSIGGPSEHKTEIQKKIQERFAYLSSKYPSRVLYKTLLFDLYLGGLSYDGKNQLIRGVFWEQNRKFHDYKYFDLPGEDSIEKFLLSNKSNLITLEEDSFPKKIFFKA